MKISERRYIFSESLAFQAKKKPQIAYEILKFIPIVCIGVEAKSLLSALKKRRVYDSSHRYIFDVRLSYMSIAKHSANALGLAILILPFRLIATGMRQYYLIHGMKCDNPHRLNPDRLKTAKMINESQSEHYEGLLKICPGEEDFCHRMAYRDHVQYPEYLIPSLYKDPFEIKSDIGAKKKLHEYTKRHFQEEILKLKIQRSYHRKNNGI